MSARSSSGSWSGGGAPPDIIDLDKFMRGAVRPSRPDPHTLRTTCDKLVVDAGGVDRKPVSAPLGGGGGGGAPPALSNASSSSGSRPPPHAKRFSHDSGLSDGSYAHRKHRSHRRAPGGDSGGVRAPKTPGGSSNSLRAFRTVCERALLDQQAQIARVAQLCERLTERQPRRRDERSATPDTSDVSSSSRSRSTRDQRRKDKHRTEECKTYKIIMNKLDELNRLFAARARSPPGAARPPPGAGRPPPAPARPRSPAPAHCASPSSASVSVSDKVVATEPEHRTQLQVNHNTVTVVRGGGGSLGGRGSAGAAGAGARAAPGAGAGGSRRGQLRAVANACALDIAPLPPPQRHNVATESVLQCESGDGTGSSGDPRCGFDLEDPVHLYSQAKRLQALPASTRCARSVERERLERLDERARLERMDERARLERLDERAAQAAQAHAHAHGLRGERRDATLCALCRGYWRALRQYLAAQIFCVPDAACH